MIIDDFHAEEKLQLTDRPLPGEQLQETIAEILSSWHYLSYDEYFLILKLSL